MDQLLVERRLVSRQIAQSQHNSQKRLFIEVGGKGRKRRKKEGSGKAVFCSGIDVDNLGKYAHG